MRGEYLSIYKSVAISWELPPRARRIPIRCFLFIPTVGTTSACAENTPKRSCGRNHHRNYLRVRGEYFTRCQPVSSCSELPPRARRIRAFHWFHLDKHGTTSACAENTSDWDIDLGGFRNYLRVRGEYEVFSRVFHKHLELPPRARRIRGPTAMKRVADGTTSACAENTRPHRFPPQKLGNYLRVRGEY